MICDQNISNFPELMTEEELVVFLRIPEISKAENYKNVIMNLRRHQDLPCIHISRQPLYPRDAILQWIHDMVEKEGCK